MIQRTKKTTFTTIMTDFQFGKVGNETVVKISYYSIENSYSVYKPEIEETLYFRLMQAKDESCDAWINKKESTIVDDDLVSASSYQLYLYDFNNNIQTIAYNVTNNEALAWFHDRENLQNLKHIPLVKLNK